MGGILKINACKDVVRDDVDDIAGFTRAGRGMLLIGEEHGHSKVEAGSE